MSRFAVSRMDDLTVRVCAYRSGVVASADYAWGGVHKHNSFAH
jgi:hypothetical protein